jgi:hypothetical protein
LCVFDFDYLLLACVLVKVLRLFHFLNYCAQISSFRMSGHLVPEKGVLLLVLPLRCVNSKHIGGASKFEELLQGLGLTPLLPHRVTPKLIFFILGNSSVSPSTAADIASVPRALLHASNSETACNEELSINSKCASQNKNKSKSKSKGNTVLEREEAWIVACRQRVVSHMSKSIRSFFTKDYSRVPSNEFAVQLPFFIL